MQIVIDISEDAYKRHKKRVNMDMCTELDIAVANGTPLDDIRAEIERQRKEVSNKHSENDELQAYYDGLNDGLKDARDILDKSGQKGGLKWQI